MKFKICFKKTLISELNQFSLFKYLKSIRINKKYFKNNYYYTFKYPK